MNKKQKKMLFRILLTILIVIVVGLINVKDTIQTICMFAAYIVIGYDILRKALRGIINRQIFDENFLMAVATVGAIVLGDFKEAVAVMLFYQIGELFQSYAVGKSRRNISELMDIRPDYANIEKDGELVKVSPEEVEIGTIIVVSPGEKIPIDGIVVEGNSTIDTSALTGESIPRNIAMDDTVISGTINISGLIKIRTTKSFGESTVSKILDLVENSSMKKSKSENFISKFARYYTPFVCLGAVLLAILPPVINIISNSNPDWGVWVYRALTFLVISCPCALVISIPLSFFAGIGAAGKMGILIKGSNYVETLSKIKHIAMDKTGTLTQGTFSVIDVHNYDLDKEKMLELVAHAECFSSHPISLCIKNEYKGVINADRVKDVKELSGMGVCVNVDDVSVAVGNERLMKHLNVKCDSSDVAGTIVHVAVGNKYQGYILIADEIKHTSKTAIERLKKAGIKRIVMLTGDLEKVAQSVANELQIKEFKSELLPEDKVTMIEQLLCEKTESEKVAFVGDGINDAPVLSRADVGIAMGALGSDAAIEAADVVLMDDNPVKIASAINLSKKVMSIVKENIYFAIGVKAICLLLGALGYANMWIAIFADVGVMVLAVINAVRVLFVKECK